MSDPEPAVASSPVYRIQEREVRMPCLVRDATSGAATFLVSAPAARRLLPGRDFEVAEILPGKTPLSIAAIDYRDNDLGDYNELSIAFFVRPRGTPRGLPYLGSLWDLFRQRLGTFLYRLPVNQEFTCEAGREIWGFPKSVEEISIEHGERRSRCRLVMEGQHVLTLDLPRGGEGSLPEREMETFSYIHGVPHRTRSTLGGEGFRLSRGGSVQLSLGAHSLAQELRGLGLPKRAIMSMWIERMRGRFEAPEKL